MVGIGMNELPLVGRGFCSDVYAWGAGRVLKLFHVAMPADRAEREFRATRAVHAAGLPAPAAYELVERDGRRGIVLERIDGLSVFDYTQRRPWAIFKAIRLVAELHAQINRCSAPPELPPQRDWIASRIHSVPDMNESERSAALQR